VNLRKVPWTWVVAVVGEERISAGRRVTYSSSRELEINHKTIRSGGRLAIVC